jgi:hypothetical protein
MEIPLRRTLLVIDACLLLVGGWHVFDPMPVSAFVTEPSMTASSVPMPVQEALFSEQGECSAQSFYSAALEEQMSFSLYLPPDYSDEPDRRYPTVYLLSGGGGNYKEWVEYRICPQMDLLLRDNQVQPMIIVMPSGNDNPAVGTGSYWFNHAPPPVGDGKRWGDYIWEDMVLRHSNFRSEVSVVEFSFAGCKKTCQVYETWQV